MTDQPIPKPVRRRAATKAAMTGTAKHPRRAATPAPDAPAPAPDAPAAAPPDAPAAAPPEGTTSPARPAPAPDVAPARDPGPAAAPEIAELPPAPVYGTGSIDRVDVDLLEFERGAIGGVRAGDVAARQAVVGGIAAGHASVEMGIVNGIAAREATVQQGAVRGVLAQNVHLEQSLVRSVVANRVTTGPTTAIVVALARRIDGEAKVLLDWRGGLAFGASLGAFLALIWLGRRRG